MKKYAVPAALLLTAILAAGCGGQAAQPATETTAAVETKEAAEDKTEEKAEEKSEAAYKFTGIDNPCIAAAADWLANYSAENMKLKDGVIPVMSLAKLDDSNPDDVKLFGTFDLNNFAVDGSTLKIDETKRLTGVMHLVKDGDAYKVGETEWAEDASSLKAGLQKIVTDEAMYNEMANGAISPELKSWYIGEAVKAMGLPVDSYQEKGKNPVSLTQEPKAAEEWVEKLAQAVNSDQFVTVGKTTGSNAVLKLHEKASNGKWNTVLSAPAFIGKNGLGGENAGAGTTKTGLSDFSADQLQAFGKDIATDGGIAVPKEILDAVKGSLKKDCKLIVDTEENILNGTAVQAPKTALQQALEKVSYGEKLTNEERVVIADALQEALAGNYLGDAARYACSYTASFGTPMRDGEIDYLALSAYNFPTEIIGSNGSIPFTIGRMRSDDMGTGGMVPETLRFTAADGSTVDAYTLWTNGGCIGELVQADGTYGIFETEDGRYTLEKISDSTAQPAETAPAAPAADSPADETLQNDTAAAAGTRAAAGTAAANTQTAAAANTQTAVAAANTQAAAGTAAANTQTAPAQTQAAVQTAKANLPEYDYTGTGNGELMNAVADYLEDMGKQYGTSDITIPNIQLVGVDDSNPNDIKVYGDFWVLNYNLTGKTLENTSSGSYPGLMHLAKQGSGYVVTGFESADDGGNFQESLERICAEHPEYVEALVNGELNDDLRAETISSYVKANGLDIDFFKDYGWDPVELED